MAYVAPSINQIIAQAQNDLTAALGRPPLYTSNANILAMITAGLVDDQYQFISYCFSQTTPFTATGENLAAWAALKRIFRISSVAAAGTINFTGTAGVLVPNGTVVIGSNQQQYVTQADYTIGTSANVAIQAVTPGLVGNAVSGMVMSLVSSITGVTGSVLAQSPTDGVDIESDASLRSRMLQRYANPPQGGSLADYIGWQLAVPGVTRAWAIGNQITSGTVTLYPMFDNVNASENGFPQGSNGVATLENRASPTATGDQLLVANAIYPLRPITSLIFVNCPVPQYVDISISGIGVANTWNGSSWASTPITIEDSILSAIQDIFIRLGTVYGFSIPISAFYEAVGSVSGVTSFSIDSPSTNVAIAVGSLPVVRNLVIS